MPLAQVWHTVLSWNRLQPLSVQPTRWCYQPLLELLMHGHQRQWKKPPTTPDISHMSTLRRLFSSLSFSECKGSHHSRGPLQLPCHKTEAHDQSHHRHHWELSLWQRGLHRIGRMSTLMGAPPCAQNPEELNSGQQTRTDLLAGSPFTWPLLARPRRRWACTWQGAARSPYSKG